MTPRKEHLLDRIRLMHIRTHKSCESIHKTYIQSFKPDRTPAPRSPTPNQGAICNWHLLERGKSVFSDRLTVVISTILQGRPHAQEEYWSILNRSHIFLCVFCYVWWLVFLLCFGACFCCLFCVLSFFPLFEEKEHDVRWVRKWVGSVETWGRGENMIKIYCMKNLRIRNMYFLTVYGCLTCIHLCVPCGYRRGWQISYYWNYRWWLWTAMWVLANWT